MDHLRRLGFAFFMLCGIVAMFAPRLARAVDYEYTPKVWGSPGVPKETVPGYRARKGTGTWYTGSTQEAACQAYGATTATGWSACSYMQRSKNQGVGRWAGPYGNPGNCQIQGAWEGCDGGGGSGTWWFLDSSVVEYAPTQQCPMGTSEKTPSDGLCYPQVCPTATPPWETDPGDSSRCRRPGECPAPQTFSAAANGGNGGCICQSGRQVYVPEGGGIAETAYWSSSVASTTAPTGLPETLCGRLGTNTAGCSVEVEAAGWDGLKITYSGTRLTGATCTATGGTEAGSDKPCPTGQVRGTINGQSICVTGGVTETKKPPTTTTEITTNPDGSTVETTTTTQETTKCEGDVCTTTITKTVTKTTKDANGNPTGTTTTEGTETKDGKGSGGTGDGEGGGVESSFGGSCPSFACEGDAVQCAIALEQHKRNCEMLTNAGELTREAAVAAFDEAREFDKTQLTTEGTLSGVGSSTFLGGGCLADATYNIRGYSFVIPFSSLCVYLQAAGLAFLTVCGLISFGIVSRGVTA